jgi:uncharacterized membrane protein YhaH (DUF805 family)
MRWFIGAVKRYAVFSGRARRKEYWFFVLFYVLIYWIASLIDYRFGLLALLALALPSCAVGFRRLHDTGRSGWWTLLGFIPLVGSLVLLVFMAQDSQAETNRYGPNPKAAVV